MRLLRIWNAENKADFFRLTSAIPDTILLSVKNTGLKKLIRVRVIFIICLKLIIVVIKYHKIDFSYYIQYYYLSLINYDTLFGYTFRIMFRLHSALDELSKRDTLTKGGDTLFE